jgi:hypothetical protein
MEVVRITIRITPAARTRLCRARGYAARSNSAASRAHGFIVGGGWAGVRGRVARRLPEWILARSHLARGSRCYGSRRSGSIGMGGSTRAFGRSSPETCIPNTATDASSGGTSSGSMPPEVTEHDAEQVERAGALALVVQSRPELKKVAKRECRDTQASGR